MKDIAWGHGIMRDFQTDWNDWSLIERLAAMFLVMLASFAVGALVYLQT